jgi:ribonuclease HII
MQNAFCHPQPEYIIVDGISSLFEKKENSSGKIFTQAEDFTIPSNSKGDSKFMSIAAASVLAKTYRVMNT